MGKIYTVVHLESGILTYPSELGDIIPITIGECQGRLHIPIVPNHFENYDFSAIRLGPGLASPIEFIGYNEDEKPLWWGRACSSDMCEINRLGFIFHFNGPDQNYEIGNKILIDFGRWMKDFLSYVEYTTDRMISGRGYNNDIDQKARMPYLFNKDMDNGKLTNATHEPHVISASIVFPLQMKEQRVDSAIIKRFCNYCSDKQELKLEHELMLEARRALYCQDFRKAILDAATSAEVVLTQKCREAMIDFDGQLTEEILKKFTMLSGRYNLLGALNIKLPISQSEFNSALNTPRNKVIHGGFSPNIRNVEDAFKVSERFLAEFSPKIA